MAAAAHFPVADHPELARPALAQFAQRPFSSIDNDFVHNLEFISILNDFQMRENILSD
jgi:hypothetical protein